MEIMRVVDDLVCTRRVPGLNLSSLRVLENAEGWLSGGDRSGGRAAGEMGVHRQWQRRALGDAGCEDADRSDHLRNHRQLGRVRSSG